MWGSREREFEVWTDASGRQHRTPKGRRDVAEIKAASRAAEDREDRTGQRLRWGSKGVAGWWYMVKGPKRWIKQERHPGWHNGYWYTPGKWYPVVPPRSEWPSPRAYSAPPGVMLSGLVPEEIRRAATMEPEERKGRRVIGRGADIPARSEQWQKRRDRGPREYGSARWFARS